MPWASPASRRQIIATSSPTATTCLQRFHRVEAGTIRMATNLAVDLSELFVMPRVSVHPAADPEQPAADPLRRI